MSARISLPPTVAIASALGRLSRGAYEFRSEAGLVRALVLVLGFAALTGLLAQVYIPLPFTPVPITGQVLGVLLAGGVLGRRLAPLSQAAYVGAGALGLPWFAPATGAAPFTTGGLAILTGVTGGYLIGFVIAAAVTGWLIDRAVRNRTFGANLLVLLCGVGIIYLAGALQLALLLRTMWSETLLYGVLPFLPGDLLKSVLGASLLLGLVPRTSDPRRVGLAAWSRRLGARDYALVGGMLGGLWLLVPVVAALPGSTAVLASFYAIAAGVASAAILGALGLRSRLAFVTRALRAEGAREPSE